MDFTDPILMEGQLKQVNDLYVLARGAAMSLCDENGVLLFSHQSTEDLE